MDHCADASTNPFLALSLYPSFTARIYHRATRSRLSYIDPSLTASPPSGDWLDTDDTRYGLIKAQYKALALANHPDKNPNGLARFHAVTAAHESLSALLKADSPSSVPDPSPNHCISWYNTQVLALPMHPNLPPPPLTYSSLLRLFAVSDASCTALHNSLLTILVLLCLSLVARARTRASSRTTALSESRKTALANVATLRAARLVAHAPTAPSLLTSTSPTTAHMPRPLTPPPLSPLNFDVPSHAASYSSLLTTLLSVRATLVTLQSKELTADAATLLPTILKYICQYPDTAKYYSVKVGSNKFGRYVYRYKNVQNLLTLCGFVCNEERTEIKLQFPAGKRLRRMLNVVMQELKHYEVGGGARLPSPVCDEDLLPVTDGVVSQKVDVGLKTKLVSLFQNEGTVAVDVLSKIAAAKPAEYGNVCLRINSPPMAFTTVPTVPDLSFITVLKITRARGLRSLEGLGGMEGLKMITVNYCDLKEFPELPGSAMLVDLGDNAIAKIGEGVGVGGGLRSLDLSGNLLGAGSLSGLGRICAGNEGLKNLAVGANFFTEEAIAEFEEREEVMIKLVVE